MKTSPAILMTHECAPLLGGVDNPSSSHCPSHQAATPAPPLGGETVAERAAALRGYVLVFVSALMQAVRALLFHDALSRSPLPAAAGLLVSAIVFTSLSTGYLVLSGTWRRIKVRRVEMAQLTARGLISGVMVFLNNVALARIPVGTALTLFATAPAGTSVLAAAFLGDRITLPDAGVLVVNLIGIALVAQPTGASGPDGAFGVGAALLDAVLIATSFTLVKAMGTRVHYMLNLLAIGLGGALMCCFVVDAAALAAIINNPRAVGIVFAGTVAGFVAQAFLNRAMQLCRPGPALVVRSMNVPASFVLGFVFMSETVQLSELFGSVLVLASVMYIGLSQIFRKQEAAAARQALGSGGDARRSTLSDAKVLTSAS